MSGFEVLSHQSLLTTHLLRRFESGDFVFSAERIWAERTLERETHYESASFPHLALNREVAAVLAHDFAADCQAEASPLRAFSTDERFENVRLLMRRYADAVVDYDNSDPITFVFQGGQDSKLRILPSLDRVERIGDDI